MKLNLKEVRDSGPLDLEETLPAGQISAELPAPVRLRVHAEVLDDEILALIAAETTAALECARCLDRFEKPLKSSLELHVPVSAEDLEVGEEARQGLLLALPVKPLCRPDCRGLCPRCGANLNVAPCHCAAETSGGAFDALKDLKLR